MKYRIIDNTILLSLKKNEYINSSIKGIFKDNNLKFGWISGIGAVHNIELGFYDLDSKQYLRKIIKEEHELLSLTGNVTFVDDEYFVHNHISIGNRNFQSFGGHLFEGQISLTGEFKIDILSEKVDRKFSNEIGLNLWCIYNEGY